METQPQPQEQARRRMMRRRLGVGAASAAGHAALLLALFLQPADPPLPPPSEPMIVALIDLAPPALAPGPAASEPAAAAPAPPTPAKPRPPVIKARNTPVPPDVSPLPAAEEPSEDRGADQVSDSELASAASAGSGVGAGSGSGSGGGGGGRSCDMAAYLQAELRKDEQVQAAFARARTSEPARKAVRVWNGDWVRSHGQEGAGLAVVREAILMEVAFAPVACRTQAMRGLVLISLDDGPGALRLALGAGQWRWSDLLTPRRTAAS